MNKIKTLFKRGINFGVINEYNIDTELLQAIRERGIATEKVDGVNIRLTIRNEDYVRIEARKNPTKEQKKQGILDAWYRDAQLPNDKNIIKAVENREYLGFKDGEYSAEAFGGKIQGNPLERDYGVFMFSDNKELKWTIYDNAPTTYDELREWLSKQKSHFNDNCGIEGLVYWLDGKPVAKIKIKDFKNL